MHADRLGATPTLAGVAPGRVNLIGEHTDYNDGFVFPMAIPFVTAVAVSLRPDRRVVGHSTRFGTTEFEIDNKPPPPMDGDATSTAWLGCWPTTGSRSAASTRPS